MLLSAFFSIDARNQCSKRFDWFIHFQLRKPKIHFTSWTDIWQVDVKLFLLLSVLTTLLVPGQCYDEKVFDVKQLMERIETLEQCQVATENRHQRELNALRSKLQGKFF